MNSVTIRRNIEANLRNFDQQPLREASTAFLNTLGYHSRRVGNDGIDNDRFERLVGTALETANPSQRLSVDDWQVFHILLQVADDEINEQITGHGSLFQSNEIDDALMSSYMFVAVQLAGDTYTRTQLSNITRFINRQIRQPIMVIFRYGGVLTLAIINRRQHRRDPLKQVLEKVTLIKDINLNQPKRAHIDIVSELDLQRLAENESVRNFDTLHKAWEITLNTEALNRQFYRDLEEWYNWAKAECTFPDSENDMQVIRMITRLLFIWFLKEKGLVPDNLFENKGTLVHLEDFDLETSDYYQAVLQNLFFATLNTPIDERVFSRRNRQDHRNKSKYRYEDLLQNPNEFLEYLKQVPFVNGGLFDCLDTFEATGYGGERIDCFTDNPNHRQRLHVPAKLFFDAEYGIFPLFNRYKFTVEENTPVEQEVALDPELLGQVFENLLGAYNPETQTTARRTTGSYYTPRQIVDYMVDEALIAYFLQKVDSYDNDKKYFEDRLRDDLLAYDQQGRIDKSDDHLIDENEIEPIIAAIDELKIIDPAVGSGAFPMGILNKLVLILKKLDPQNEHWKQRQLQQVAKINDPEVQDSTAKAIEEVFSEANCYNDYGRKLYLIQNCIYGVDIQPIAITIAKLRFFISLIIDQVPNDNPNDNYGIRPLPNLEVKFVAANTLIGLNRRETQLLLGTNEIEAVRESISRIRERYFMANTRRQKLELIDEEKVRRAELTQLLARGTEQGILRETDATVEMADRIASWDPYDQNAAADFFDTEWIFGIKDGFDIAIGNPPYIRHERIRHLRPALQRQFGDFFTNTADISVYFYKRAAELLRNGGFLTYICTNKFMRSGYGRNLRQFLTTDMSLRILLDFGSVSVFDTAVDTCIVLVEKCLPAANHAVRAVTLRETSDDFNVREAFQDQAFPIQIAQLSSEEWTVAHPDTLALIEKLQSTGRSFNEAVQGKFYFGIKTGCNDAFIINATTRDCLIAENIDSHELIKLLLRGRDLRRWEAAFADEYLIAIASSANNEWPWSNAVTVSEAEQVFSETYPAIYQHLSGYRERLVARADQGMFYWELRSCAYYAEFDKPKIVYPDISSSMRACYDTTKALCLQSAYILPTNDFSLLAILNSRLFDWYAKHKFQSLNDPWAGGGLRFIAQYMRHAPIADRTSAQKAELSGLVEQILEDPENENVRALEKEIDALVYRLYGLTTNEIALIEQTYRDAGMEV